MLPGGEREGHHPAVGVPVQAEQVVAGGQDQQGSVHTSPHHGDTTGCNALHGRAQAAWSPPRTAPGASVPAASGPRSSRPLPRLAGAPALLALSGKPLLILWTRALPALPWEALLDSSPAVVTPDLLLWDATLPGSSRLSL